MTASKSTRAKGIYLLPNLLTTAGLFLGYMAIVYAMSGHFSSAAIAILIAMITDALDGRIARLTQTQTPFGAQYDSLSDMVVFGLAPSLVNYEWALFHLGKFGWLVSFLYTACTALRLARFNTQIESGDKRYFQGLACTAAAGVIASMIWFGHNYGLEGQTYYIISAIIMLSISALMVSNIRYRSFKEVDFSDKVPFFAMLFVVLTFIAIAIDPPSVLFFIFFGYAASGPIQTLIFMRRVRQLRKRRKLKKEKHINL